MPNATIPLTSFTGGEWSPRLHGRIDIDKYSSACQKIKNMVLYPHGGLTRRMGFEFIGNAKVNDVRLIPFEYNSEQAYVLEFGAGYIRFFRSGAQIAPLGVPYEISTTYTFNEVSELGFAQSNDVLYLVHRNHPPKILSRTGPDTFALTSVVFTMQPAEWAASASNYPSVVTFFQSRLVLSGCPQQPQSIWLSKVSAFTDFTIGAGASDALKFTLASNQLNAIKWIIAGHKLLIGTSGGEWTMELPANSALSVMARRESNFGSKTGRTQLVGTGVLYASRDGKKLREMSYSFEADGFSSPELSILSEHLTRKGIKEFNFAQNPDGILWTLMNDGSLSGFTYLKSQEVKGWHRHETQGIIQSICTIENDNGSELWAAVLRNGATRIERMASSFNGESANDLGCAYLDSFLSRSGAPTISVSGLGHLEGKTVSILADGQHHSDKVVTSGSVTLDIMASNIIVGLSYEWSIVPLRLEGGSPMGFAQGKRKRVVDIICRVERTAGISHRDPSRPEFAAPLPARNFGDNFDTAVSLFSGDIPILLHPGWDREGQFELYGSSPLPVTILMIAARVSVNE